MIRSFVESPDLWSVADQQVVAIEEEMQDEVDSDIPNVLARVDLIVLDNDHLRVLDFKTSRAR
jgi:hypothetical protein